MNFLSKFFTWLGKLLSDNSLNPSSSRVITVAICLLFAIVIAIGYLYVVKDYKDLLVTMTILLLSMIAALMGIKWGTKATELKNEPDKPEDKPEVTP